MGMFDYLVCEDELPQRAEFAGPLHKYQTKDFECRLETLVIRNGRITGHAKLHGTVSFYDCNLSVGAYGHSFTEDGSDYEWVSYIAAFSEGVVTKIDRVEYERKPALSSAEYNSIDASLPVFESRIEEDIKEGQSLFMLWGGMPIERGYEVTVRIVNDSQLVLEGPDGLKTLDRCFAGHLLMADRDDAVARLQSREDRQREADRRIQDLLNRKVGAS